MSRTTPLRTFAKPMNRRTRSRRPDPVVPRDWTEHDGEGCPVDPASMPGVMFRAGTRFQPDKRRAEEWQHFSSGDCWYWAGQEPDGFDIIAYKPESEYVEIPRGGSVI